MANHIDHIEITNFKSIRHQKIEGCKRINVFIGYPNVGKSAILEAISSLGYLQKDFNESFNKLCRLRDSYELFFDANTKEDATISYTEKNVVRFKYVSEQVINLSIVDLETDDPHIRDMKVMELITGNSKSVGSRIFEDIIKVKKYSFQDKYNNHKTNGLSLFFPFGENLVDVIHLNKELRKEVGELFKQYNLKLLIDPSTNNIKGFKQLDEETVFTIPFYQMADTLQRLIFHKAAIMSNENAVLLFEEPEAHMFPPYISSLAGEVIYDKKGNQYFIATHSPFVMNDFLEDAREDLSVYLVGLKDGETRIKRLSDDEMHEVYQYGVDLFFNIESYLD